MDPARRELTVQWGRIKTRDSKVTRSTCMRSWVCDGAQEGPDLLWVLRKGVPQK